MNRSVQEVKTKRNTKSLLSEKVIKEAKSSIYIDADNIEKDKTKAGESDSDSPTRKKEGGDKNRKTGHR